ncbi:MAG: hypothetical protein MJZ20_06950 [Bacteroidaceae bacterium]|nr:hypothetical protein [Bacteroidaceae bacterium]
MWKLIDIACKLVQIRWITDKSTGELSKKEYWFYFEKGEELPLGTIITKVGHDDGKIVGYTTTDASFIKEHNIYKKICITKAGHFTTSPLKTSDYTPVRALKGKKPKEAAPKAKAIVIG